MFDVLVIGGGLAGATAALTARAAGASVALASRSWGATALSTGALDIGYAPAISPERAAPRTLRDNINDIIAHRPRHPYGMLGSEQAQKCILAGYAVLKQVLADGDLDIPDIDFGQENAFMASSLGTLLPAATAMAPHRGFAAGQSGRWGILKLAGDAYLDADRVSRGVAHDAAARFGSAIDFVTIAATCGSGQPLDVAHALDDENVAIDLAKQIKPRLQGCDGLLVPPVLGLNRHRQVRALLSEALGVPVVEALAHMPSVPGIRLQKALNSAVSKAGVHVVGPVKTPEVNGRLVNGFITQDNLAIHAGSVILATGRFIAGGLVWNDRCQEALLGLPVVTELGMLEAQQPQSVVRRTPVESHPLMTAGIKVNKQLRPVVEGRVAYDNVYAAGMIIGGFASRYTLCADGVALADGLAGR